MTEEQRFEEAKWAAASLFGLMCALVAALWAIWRDSGAVYLLLAFLFFAFMLYQSISHNAYHLLSHILLQCNPNPI
jgi:hypothetical protein